MQGALRFYLAACVVHAHMWIYLGMAPMSLWWNGIAVSGRIAVVGFFIISGFVAGVQIDGRFFDGVTVDVVAYYRDRLLRIYPTYLLVVACAAPIYFLWSQMGRS